MAAGEETTLGPLTASGIPRSLSPAFQEYALEHLDPSTHANLVIERVLALGNRVELRWLFRQYGRRQVTDWLECLGRRRLTRRRYHMWCVLLHLPIPSRAETRGIWPY